MQVSRRTAIKQALLVSAGFALLPSCVRTAPPASVKLKNLDVNGDDEKMLAELTSTILPTTDTPGAKEIGAHLFALTMLDDCYDKETQKKWVEGMKAFKELWSKENKEALLTKLEKEDAANSPAAYFYHMTKRLTIQSYTSSEYFMTKVEEWQLVPGRFHGSIPVTEIKKKTL
jgi:hypothetical protein